MAGTTPVNRQTSVIRFLSTMIAVAALFGSAQAQTIIYVDTLAGGSETGTSWCDAFTNLQPAIDAALPGNYIHVAQGTYRPCEPCGAMMQSATFTLKGGVVIRGGFAGVQAGCTQPEADDRDIVAFESRLSGDLLQDDIPGEFPNGASFADNSYHVVTATGVGPGTALDGLTIRDGNAVGGMPDDSGGALQQSGGNLTVVGCTFTRNAAILGGAVSNTNGGLLVLRGSDVGPALFDDNRALGVGGPTGGGAVFNNGTLVAIDCALTNNESTHDAGALRTSGSTTLEGCSFDANTAQTDGGAVLNDGGTLTIKMSSFTGNGAGANGGALALRLGTTTVGVAASTITGNFAGVDGGGVFDNIPGPDAVRFDGVSIDGNTAVMRGGGLMEAGAAAALLSSCRFFDNTAQTMGGGAIHQAGTASTVFANCTVVENTAVGGAAGGILVSGMSSVQIDNSILWGNTDNAPGTTEDAQINGAGTITVNSTCIEMLTGALGGTDNIADDPMFIDQAAGNLRLSIGSPMIDAGNNDAVPIDALDLDGDTIFLEPASRDRDGLLRLVNDPATSGPAPPTVDLGAYEFANCDDDGTPDGQELSDGSALDGDSDGVIDDCDVIWAAASDGDFDVGLNWNGGLKPSPGQVAVFDPIGAYTVTFNAVENTLGLKVYAGAPTFDLSGSFCNVIGTMTLGLESGSTSAATIQNGAMSAAVAEIGVRGHGDLLLGAGSVLSTQRAFIGVQPGGSGIVQLVADAVWNATSTPLPSDGIVQVGKPGGGLLSVVGNAMLDADIVVVEFGGTLQGTGTVDANIVNVGVVRPGVSPGALTIDGDYTQTSGRLVIEIGGTAAATEYDQLLISGTADLGGILDVKLINGFSPDLADEFDIISFAGLTQSCVPPPDDPDTPCALFLKPHFNGLTFALESTQTGVSLGIINDCNGNDVDDAADIDMGGSQDDYPVGMPNGVPDECDIANCPPDDVDCDDCNLNGVPDACDVDPVCGTSSDANMDGVPDECTTFNGMGNCALPNGWMCPDNWDLPDVMAYPDNVVHGAFGPFFVGLEDAFDVVLDVDASIDTLLVRDSAVLEVSAGDLTITSSVADDLALLLKSEMLTTNNHSIVVDGRMVVGAGGVYRAMSVPGPGGGDQSSIDGGELEIEEGPVSLEGTFELTGEMSAIFGGAVMTGVDDGCSEPILIVTDSAQLTLTGDCPSRTPDQDCGLVIRGNANITYNSTEPLQLDGDFVNESTMPEQFAWLDGSMCIGNCSGTGSGAAFAVTVEAAGVDLGATSTALTDNFAIGTLHIGGNAAVTFVDHHDNDTLGGLNDCTEALYVRHLIIDPGATLTLDGCNIYALTIDQQGEVIEETCGTLQAIPAVQTVSECADLDANAIRDDNCTWSAVDADGACAPVTVLFGDLGGPNGSCEPDGTADANDRFHALNCFSNQNTLGESGYPCESAPPTAFNADAGGSFGTCCPDGVCDANDAFHAINVFSADNPCACPANFVCPCARPTDPPESPVLCPATGGPAPIAPGPAPTLMESTGVALITNAARKRADHQFEVHAILTDNLSDLRGYQLHLGISGGRRGYLELVDIFVLDRADHVFSGHGTWRAFNVESRQMLVGMDTAGIPVSRGGYMATFVLRPSRDAAGTFAIQLLANRRDPGERTYLFPTRPGTHLEVDASEPALIHIERSRTVKKRMP